MLYLVCCENCGEFEINQSIKEPSLKICPKCGGKCWHVPTLVEVNMVGPNWSNKEAIKAHRKNHGKEKVVYSED